MKYAKVIGVLLILLSMGLAFDTSCTKAQSTLTQFGNLDFNTSWNAEGDVVVASQFTIQSSITVTWISAYTVDESPYSVFRLGIFSDSNNEPFTCLASTAIVPSQTNQGWYQLPLSNAITLQAGTYWLAETDSGAGVLKYIETPDSAITVYTPPYGTSGALADSLGSLSVGSQLSAPLIVLSGCLAIIASSGPPSIPGVQPPVTYAESAQCWTSASSSNPLPEQTSFAVGQPVYIYWTPSNPASGDVNIWVYYPAGTPPGNAICCSFIEVSPGTPITFTPSYAGTWIVDCNGYSTTTSTVSVIVGGSSFPSPEYELGALLSLTACLAAFFVFFKIRQQPVRSSK